MPPRSVRIERETVRRAIREARRLAAMLQGTMGLEGQGLDRPTLKIVRKQMIRRLLGMDR